VLEALLVGSVAVAVGVAARVVYLESLETTNLVWNLFLAWIPLALALVVYDGARRGWTAGTLVTVGLAWLLFLPNAPYIVTDLKWLGQYNSGTHWFDPVLIGAAAGIGLVLGFLSLYLVQAVVVSRLGRVAGWTLAFAALAASGVGVYLGRFQRWNSWDVFTEPTRVVGQLASAAIDPLAHGRPLSASRGAEPAGGDRTMSSMELTARKREILRRVVEEYVATGQPVGSKVLVERPGLDVSSSTVRSELSELEALGLLTHSVRCETSSRRRSVRRPRRCPTRRTSWPSSPRRRSRRRPCATSRCCSCSRAS
jgi:uncharacterized membrane protein